MDVFTPAKRSDVMSRIRSRGNRSTDRKLAAMLRARKISGWKMHTSTVMGCPDFYFPFHRIAVFVDGCFWHACKKCFQMPASNRIFWATKIFKNTKRDREVTRALKRAEVRVLRIWEHDLEKKTHRVRRLIDALKVMTTEEVGRPSSHSRTVPKAVVSLIRTPDTVIPLRKSRAEASPRRF
jgi:DNA mismatch endonuclease, patch repair protein